MKQQHLEDSVQASELPLGSMLLQGQYEIQGHLAVGGFGITYLARDSLSRQVVVKECFPDGMCVRSGKLVLPDSEEKQVVYQKIVWNFVAEARRLARLKHPNIVAVHQVFEENHTAYMAMDFVDGEELLDILETKPERLTPDLLEDALRAALDAVQHLHEAGFLHRDISPDNLLLDASDHLTLIDFGAARENSRESTQGSATANTFLLAVKDGYSPHEFYVEDAPQDASSDLYSLAATFYHLITGAAPPDCWSRHQAIEAGQRDPYVPLAQDDWGFAPIFLALIDQALSVAKAERIQSAAEWLERLGDKPEAAPEPSAQPEVRRRELPKTVILPAAELDLQAISQLVEDTNTRLSDTTATVPGPLPKLQLPPELAEQADPPKQPVDILGNPIEDVESWLKEQDRIARKRGWEEPPNGYDQSEYDEARPKSLILRLLTAPFGLARNTASTV